MTFISYAQNFEDVTLWRALKDVPNGFYIDVGAWEPDLDSVTRAFSDRGWTGINVEPVPKLHAALLRCRPRDINLLAAVGAAPATATFFEFEGTGLSTMDGDLANAHLAHGFGVARRAVDVITLADICRAHAADTIHFLKIDCEGAERAVLAGADFVRFRPWIVLLEALEPGSLTPNHADWEDLLVAAGYRFAWFDALNRFYIADEHYERLAPRLALPPNVFDQFVPAAQMPSGPAEIVDPLVAATPLWLSTEQRIALAAQCRDCDDVPKVAGAGRVEAEPDGTRVQLMHNGLKVLADGYCGEWMTRLIRLCNGHHEPQEERLFHEALRLLPDDATMIELGGNWSYYSAWFLQGAPGRRAVVLEPDSANRAVGERTMALNGLQAIFVAGFAGAVPAPPAPFPTERSGTLDLPCFSVTQLMTAHGIEHLDLLHCDTQGAELAVLTGCLALLAAQRIGLLFVSTHVHHITGDPLTHQRCLALLRAAGAVIEAEHDPGESFSGDGLIVARMTSAPAGQREVAISFGRAGATLFRHPSFDLAEALGQKRSCQRLAGQVITGMFEALLFRGLDQQGLGHFTTALLQGGDFAGLLRSVLTSPEFASKRGRFGAAYLSEQERLPGERLFATPPSSPLACTAVELTLQQDGPLGAKGERLVLPNDTVILPAVVTTGAWNPIQVAFLAARVDPATRYAVLDIGANVGLFTRQVLRAFANIDACHCVEPDPSNYRALCSNLAEDRDAAIHTYNLALGEADGTAIFFRDAENCGNYSLHPDAMRNRPSAQTEVTVAAAGAWLERHAPAEGKLIWKTDTQGNDEVIVAQAPWAVWRRVEMAVIELWRIRKAGGIPDGFFEKVADFPHRALGGRAVSATDIARFLSGDDWAHDDLFLWR